MPNSSQHRVELISGQSLVLDVAFVSFPEARETGRIIQRLGHAFSAEMRAQGAPKPLLVVQHLEIRSLFGVFRDLMTLGEAASSIVNQGSLVSEFLRRVAVAYVTLQDANGGYIPPSIRSLILALVAPVAAGRARDARLSVHGDNNNIIYIEQADALIVDEVMRRPVAKAAIERVEPSSAEGWAEIPLQGRIRADRPRGDTVQVLISRAEWLERENTFANLIWKGDALWALPKNYPEPVRAVLSPRKRAALFEGHSYQALGRLIAPGAKVVANIDEGPVPAFQIVAIRPVGDTMEPYPWQEI